MAKVKLYVEDMLNNYPVNIFSSIFVDGQKENNNILKTNYETLSDKKLYSQFTPKVFKKLITSNLENVNAGINNLLQEVANRFCQSKGLNNIKIELTQPINKKDKPTTTVGHYSYKDNKICVFENLANMFCPTIWPPIIDDDNANLMIGEMIHTLFHELTHYEQYCDMHKLVNNLDGNYTNKDNLHKTSVLFSLMNEWERFNSYLIKNENIVGIEPIDSKESLSTYRFSIAEIEADIKSFQYMKNLKNNNFIKETVYKPIIRRELTSSYINDGYIGLYNFDCDNIRTRYNNTLKFLTDTIGDNCQNNLFNMINNFIPEIENTDNYFKKLTCLLNEKAIEQAQEVSEISNRKTVSRLADLCQ